VAPFEVIWPDEMHSLPTPCAWAAMILCGRVPLTSGAAMAMALPPKDDIPKG